MSLKFLLFTKEGTFMLPGVQITAITAFIFSMCKLETMF